MRKLRARYRDDHWAGARHALAHARLPEADRMDTCITCHALIPCRWRAKQWRRACIARAATEARRPMSPGAE